MLELTRCKSRSPICNRWSNFSSHTTNLAASLKMNRKKWKCPTQVRGHNERIIHGSCTIDPFQVVYLPWFFPCLFRVTVRFLMPKLAMYDHNHNHVLEVIMHLQNHRNPTKIVNKIVPHVPPLNHPENTYTVHGRNPANHPTCRKPCK